MKKMDYMAVAEKAMTQIRKGGAFLTVRAGSALNTMTIGWASIGFVWSRPILMVAVRDSRHTFKIIDKAADFTVCVPLKGMEEALMFCGTKSGRDVDKFTACNLRTRDSREVVSPTIEIPGLHFECRIVLKATMDPKQMAEGLAGLYPERDYHTLYFGEILDCYEME